MINIKNSAFLGAKKRLYSACSKIHLSVNISILNASNKSVIIIVTHYVGKDGQLKTMLLVLKEIFGKHTSENLSKYVLATIVR